MSIETGSPTRVHAINPIVLSHHFGVVRAGQSVEHAFTVSNPSKEDWTVSRIVNSCRCTFAKDLPSVIEAGSSADVRVVYDAKGDARDDSTTVRIAFKERSSRTFTLQVSANVRPPLTILPSSLHVSVHPGGSHQSQVEVQNFSDVVWAGISVKPSLDWIAAEIVQLPAPDPAENSPLKQRWRVALTVTPSHSLLTSVQANVAVSVPDTSTVEYVPLSINIRTAAVVIPSELFLGRTTPSEETTKYTVLHFRDASDIPKDVSLITIEHNLGDELQVSWTQHDGDRWKLKSTFRPNSSRGFVDGSITIRFDESDLPPLSIPVRGIVEE
ncbi:MAG: DUF1573 domain-containing protein [Planctomycetota bacterium]|nr:DUF1573 domain-containing protein [Planctomycetota bacterium]